MKPILALKFWLQTGQYFPGGKGGRDCCSLRCLPSPFSPLDLDIASSLRRSIDHYTPSSSALFVIRTSEYFLGPNVLICVRFKP